MGTLFDQLCPPAPRPYSAYAPIRARPARGRREPGGARDPRAREAEIERIARQLAVVGQTVPWGRVQDDAWDGLSRFIYRLRTAASVRAEAERVAGERRIDPTAFGHYALRRWYCFWGARLAELLFQAHAGVRPGPPRHHEIDFTIDGQPFDLKTSEVPRRFLESIDSLTADPGKVASWLYQHQSREGRYHTANRIFLLLCDPQAPDEAWRLRADVSALRQAIDGFMARRRFVVLELPDALGRPRPVLSAVVPVLRQPGPRQLRLEMPGRADGPVPARPDRPPPEPRTLPLF
jgi:hypothetical protein